MQTNNKLREALEELVANIEMRSSTFGLNVMVDTKTFLDAKAVLAEPVKNCEVGTAEERLYRYNQLRDEINERYKRLGEIPPSFAFPTAFEWEDRPYEEGGAE